MLISREEFYLRWSFRSFKTIREEERLMDIQPLIKEAMADAKFRNHEYLFDGSDLAALKCDDEVGINIHCKAGVKTEAERLKFVTNQIRSGTYMPVPIFQHWEYPDLIYIDDGFHRVYAAWQLGRSYLKCKIKLGEFKLSKAIGMKDLSSLLGMAIDLFGKDYTDMRKLKKFLDEESNPKKLEHMSLQYGGIKND